MKTRILRLQPIIYLFIVLFLSFALAAQSLAGKRLDRFGQNIKDAGISTAVIARITTNSILSPFEIKVSTTKGVVTLSGLVNTDLQFEQAVMVAQSTKGVKSVSATNLKIKTSNSPISDTLITAKIKGLLLRAKILDKDNLSDSNIQVETKNGVVYIVGNVASRAQKKYIIKTAKSVDDVKSVRAALKVQ